MRVTITARRFKLTDDLKEFAENEVRRLKKYYNNIMDVEIVLGWEKKDRLAEIDIKVDGNRLAAHERSDDMKKSITLVVDKLERQITKHKAKRRGFDHEKILDGHLPDNGDVSQM
ncbi:ribosome-associated translation inhibitor RaiA [bacterium]|nr:ribosome-associated translation inhibitor RaiA [bacterium]